jgi:hypothetical protein
MTQPHDFREQLPELLDEYAPKRAPGHLFDRFAESMDDAPQRPGWATLERWFPMDSGAHLGQARQVAIMIGALLLLALALATAFVAGSRLLDNPTTIVVAADGSGQVTSLGEGVAMAGDGDRILVRPGTYVEVVTITHDVEIRGDGPIGSIIIRATDDGPSIETGALANRPRADQRYAVLIIEAEPTLSGLTFAGEHSAVVAIGGAPTITGNHFEGVGLEQLYGAERGINAIAVGGGSRATIRKNRVVDSGPIASFDLSEPLIEGNELTGGAHILGGFGDEAEVRDNHVEWASWGIESRGDTAPVIEGNTIIEVGLPIRAEHGAAIIRGNHIEHGTSSDTGIQYDDGSGTIEGNTVNGYARGVAATGFDGVISRNTIDSGFEGVTLTDSTGTVRDNRIKAIFSGITVSRSSPDIVDNTIEGSITGVSVAGEESAPTFSGNQLCGTSRTVSISDGAPAPDPSGLESCPEAQADGSTDMGTGSGVSG